MSEDWQHDMANNPQAVNRQDHFRAVDQLQYGGRADSGATEETTRKDFYEVDPEQIDRLHAEQFVKDLRRVLFRNAMVEKGLDYDQAYRSLADVERRVVAKNGEGSSLNASSLAYLAAHPLKLDSTNKALNEWLSTHGNAWCRKLEKDFKKANAKRAKAKAKEEARSRSRAKSVGAPASKKSAPPFAAASFVVGLLTVVFSVWFWGKIFLLIFK